MRERSLVDTLLRPLARHPAARGLKDDAAVLAPPLGRDLVLTHDTLARGVHFLESDPPGDIAWKLLAVNLSDLAAMGARPLGVLMGLCLSEQEDGGWVMAFVEGLGTALERWAVPLLGGDTISGVQELVLGLTAIGQVERGCALGRDGARPGDRLWVTGSIGDAGLGLDVARGLAEPDDRLLARYRRPEPRLAAGAALSGLAHAAMDVSDGVLIDTERMADASGVRIVVDLAGLPLSRAAEARTRRSDDDLLARATGGDDYELLFTVEPGRSADVQALSKRLALRMTCIGEVVAGSGLEVRGIDGGSLAPTRLGWEHRTSC